MVVKKRYNLDKTEYKRLLINCKTKELKEAIIKYSDSINKPVSQIIEELMQKMIDSKDYSVSVSKTYDESSVSGIETKENILSRQIALDLYSSAIINETDAIIQQIKTTNPKSKVSRVLFIQEAIKRYLEPELIRLGYLTATVFKDKKLASKNLKALRLKLDLKPQEFLNKYFTPEGKAMLSYPQYLVIERTGSGNVERLVEHISITLNMDKEQFYNSALEFSEYINQQIF